MDFNKQVKRMIAFIDQEGEERMTEINLKTEEEVNHLYGNMINTERFRINHYYRRLEDAVEKQRVIKLSLMVNEARISVLLVKEMILLGVFEEVYNRLVDDISDQRFYEEVFFKMILQALCMVMEKNVGIRIRKKDKKLIKVVIPKVVDEFEKMSKIRVRFEVDGRIFLADNTLGGIVLFAQYGAIKVENTILSRLELVKGNILSFVRYNLFGPNPHRLFYT